MSDLAFEVEVEIDEGDVMKMNDHWWRVEEKSTERKTRSEKILWLEPLSGAGESLVLTPEEFSEKIEYTGDFHLVRKEYTNVVEAVADTEP